MCNHSLPVFMSTDESKNAVGIFNMTYVKPLSLPVFVIICQYSDICKVISVLPLSIKLVEIQSNKNGT